MKAAAMIALAMSAATGTTAFQIPAITRQVVGAAPSRTAISMSQPGPTTGAGKGLSYNPDKYTDEKNKGNYRKLSEALEVSAQLVRTLCCRLSLCMMRHPLSNQKIGLSS